MMRALALIAAAALLSAGAAAAQTAPSEWRRSDLAPDVRSAIGVSDEIEGSRYATLVALTLGSPTASAGRGAVMRAEVRCAERRWRILGVRLYSPGFADVEEDAGDDWAPLGHETPIHRLFSDVCDAPIAGPVGLTSEDPVAVLRWLNE